MSTLPPESRGTTFPKDPLSGQLFFLDVANDADPPRGWYEAHVSLSTGAETWTRLERSVGDQGDMVRPEITRERRS